MTTRETILAEIEAFCRQQGMAESTFGRLAVNDGKFVDRLREGKNIGLNTVDRVSDYIAKQNAPRAQAGAR